MEITEKMKKELMDTVNNPQNKTNSANIFIGRYINKKREEYVFGVLCQKLVKKKI